MFGIAGDKEPEVKEPVKTLRNQHRGSSVLKESEEGWTQ